LGIAGAAGSGALFSTAGMAAAAGPGVILSWLIGALFYLPIGLTYVELSAMYPEAGGPSRYSLYSHGKVLNLINAFSDLIWYLFIPPIEALAVVEGINSFWPYMISAQGNPTETGAILGAIIMLLFLPFNYFGIKAFSRLTNGLGIPKLVLYVLVALGFISLAHFGNFSVSGFAPFGFSGILAAVPLGMFAFGGIRAIPDYAEETRDKATLGSSIVWTVLGQTVLYLLFGLAFVVSLNWSQASMSVGHWALASSIPGNPFLFIADKANIVWLIVLTAVLAILSPFVTGYIYQGAGSRVLFAMGRSGYVGTRMKSVNERYGVPMWAIFAFTIVGVIVAYIAAPLPSIYGLISDAVVAGYIGFAANPVAMLARRRQGASGVIRGGNWIAAIAFATASLTIYWSGWPSVPYAVILLAIASIGFDLAYRIKDGFMNSIWYIVYILFLTLMTYIGSVGGKDVISIGIGSVIVVVVALVLFLPWGVASRLSEAAEAERPDVSA
jgi:amino acid transporter